ncbi:MAG: PadR family transcriptional regulator [Acidimicrobiales bacterium]
MRELSPTEWAVLGLLSLRSLHGFALAKSLSGDGDFGHVWTVRRPLVYRALDTLHADGLIEFGEVEKGTSGPQRRKAVVTTKGNKILLEWLAKPVAHVREARTLLLLKLVITDKLGLDSTGLVSSQLEVVDQIAAGLELQVARTTAESARKVLLFRLEVARGLRRFLLGPVSETGAFELTK